MLPKASQKRLSSRQTNDLLSYFIHLDERSPHGFPTKWDQIPRANLTTKHYSQIIYCTAVNLHAANITSQIRGKILHHIHTNDDAWLSPALQNIEHFDEQNLTNSLWAWAVLDSYYSGDTLTKAYRALRPYINLNRNSHPAHLQQVRDADLWFTGDSDIPDPERDRSPVSLDFENNILEAFNKSSFDVDRPKKPLINRLKQAIDFRVTDRKTKQEVWIEVDGGGHVLNLDSAKTPADILYNVHTYFRSALERRRAPSNSIILRIDPITGREIEKLLLQNTPKSLKKMKNLCNRAFTYAIRAGPGIHRTIDLNSTNPAKALRPMIRNDRNLGLTA